ncbi:stress-inducible protein [Streptomyces ruber]|uniref:Stress-inducible protein n=2 Tax=Streptomyces TaxID=1883 RepID=A0A918BQD3_9ACTN|nr:universal stress protein [Streptomyces ruber]GGQ82089.1 stress-inducible protein [Streptomyces ruber]
MTRPVVAGLDGSRQSVAAADWAAREALRRQLPLRLVHAGEGLPDDGAEPALPELRVPREHARHVLHAAAGQLTERYPQLQIAADRIRMRPAPALLAAADDAELLAIGSRGPGGVRGILSGSVATAVAARARRPVVLVRAGDTAAREHLPDASGQPSPHTPCRDVAVAVDTGRPCDDLLDFAFHAAALRRAPLRAVHAWHVPLMRGLPDAGERALLRQQAQRDLAALLEPWHAKYPDVFVRETLAEGHPVHALVRAAAGAGLLVVGRRRHRAAVGPHTGPVAHALIHQVTEPVALVPHD